jgi:hypothetical protein
MTLRLEDLTRESGLWNVNHVKETRALPFLEVLEKWLPCSEASIGPPE